MTIKYRAYAAASLSRADDELNSQADARVRYAALELRSAMEALVYDRLLLYEEELPAKELATWQPRKVFEVLLALDEHADSSSSLSYGIEPSPGVRPEFMTFAGTERVLSTRDLKKYYDKLGSFLHAPTVQQAREGSTLKPERMRTACAEVRAVIAEVLASPIFNINFKATSSTVVCTECSAKLVCRTPRNPGESRDVACTQCEASYRVTMDGESQPVWAPLQQEIKCGNPDCTRKVVVWQREIALGAWWTCKGCGGRNSLSLGVAYTPSAEANPPVPMTTPPPPPASDTQTQTPPP